MSPLPGGREDTNFRSLAYSVGGRWWWHRGPHRVPLGSITMAMPRPCQVCRCWGWQADFGQPTSCQTMPIAWSSTSGGGGGGTLGALPQSSCGSFGAQGTRDSECRGNQGTSRCLPENGRASEVSRAHRVLWLLLGALEAGILALCLVGCPSALRCRRCDSPICLDCLRDAYAAPRSWASSCWVTA